MKILLSLLLQVLVAVAAFTQGKSLADCDGIITSSATEGPFFKAGSPERSSLVEQKSSDTITISGSVYNEKCHPVENVRLDFWQADTKGDYDNKGYRYRGHQFTDSSGHYSLETVMPGDYSARTAHIHVKVQAQNGQILTTQIFFPGKTQNPSDSIFNSALLVKNAGNRRYIFNFVIRQ